MLSARAFAWALVAVTGLLMVVLIMQGVEAPSASAVLFWVALLIAAELLPVSLGFDTRVTMAFPILLATAIYFPVPIAMAVAGLGAFDFREVRREIPVWHALFNRVQLMLAVAVASALIDPFRDDAFSFPEGAVAIGLAAFCFVLTNLGLVTLWVNRLRGVPVREAFNNLLPRPVGGFVLSQILLAGLGAATAAAYDRIGAFVAAFLIPLLFARLSLLGARAQQELSERVQKQQQALLAATEKVFEERENERKRIAADIHDSSLQMLAAASYGCGNASEFLEAGRVDSAGQAIASARGALEKAMKELRGSLVDLRKSTVEEGGLVQTIRNFADQLATVWGSQVRIEGTVSREPPIPVALAAFQILQEGLINAMKHAQSSTVVVKISDRDGMVHIVVEDDGPGFDPQAEVGEDHVGMRLMKERALRVGGRIVLDSRPGSGTRLEAILPGAVSR